MKLVRVGQGRTGGGDDQISFMDSRRIGRAVFLDAPNQNPVAVRQTHGPPQMPRHMTRRHRHPEPRPNGRLTARQGVDPGPQIVVGGQGQIEALAEALRVQPEQPPLGVENWTARRARRQRSRVLDAAADEPAAGAAERPGHSGDLTDGGPQAAAPGSRHGEHHGPYPRQRSAPPRQWRRAGGVDFEHGEIAVHVHAKQTATLPPAVGEDARGSIAVDVVGVREDPVGGQDHAAAPMPASADADHGRRGSLGYLCHCLLKFVECAHRYSRGPAGRSRRPVAVL